MSEAQCEIDWGEPRLAPANCFGSHDPVALDDTVVCGACGAIGHGGTVDNYPNADADLRDALAGETK